MATYEEQQAALRRQVPANTAGAEELKRQGFADVSDDFIKAFNDPNIKILRGPDKPPGLKLNPGERLSPDVMMSYPPVYTILDSQGNKIRTFRPDIKDYPGDNFLDIKPLPDPKTGGVPAGLDPRPFDQLTPEEQAIRAGIPNINKGSGVVSGSDRIKNEMDLLAKNIETGLAQYGITPPDDKVDENIKAIQDDIAKRRTEIEKRKGEDITAIGKSFDTAKGELQLSQEDALAKAEGRTRIGGFFTQLEAQDILKLQRQHRLEVSALESQKQSALLTAKRAYEDQDYKLAQDQLQLARDIEKEAQQRRQAYFNNVIQFNNMSTPLSRATEKVQDTVINWMSKYPDAFTGLEPADLLNMSVNEAYSRVVNSSIYKKELEKKAADEIDYSIQEVNGRKIRYGFDKSGKVVSKVDLGSSTKPETPVDKVKKSPGWKTLSATQQNSLLAAGVSEADAADITELILGGTDLETIRQGLRSIGKDPKILDTYDRIVNIANLLNPARTQFKVKTSEEEDLEELFKK